MTIRTRNIFIIIISGMGMLLSTLDTGIINVALPFFQKEFNVSASLSALSVVSYTLSLSILILPFGYLSDQFGKLKISLIGLILFGLGSILCGTANNIFELILFRAIQGIGAAALQATSAALITTLVDRKFISNALGILGIMIGLGPVLGPSIGGLFLSMGLWRLIFWINIPFVVLGVACNYLLIKTISEKKIRNYFDIWGSILNSLLVISLLAGFSLLSNPKNLTLALSLILLGVILIIIFYLFEIRKKTPLINFKTLNTNPKAWLYLGQTFVFGFSSAMIFLLPPFVFEKIMNLNVGLTGLLVLGAPLGLVIFSRISGQLNHGMHNSAFSFWGLFAICASLVGLLTMNYQWPALIMTCFLFVYGIGGGIFQPANIATIMNIGNQNEQGSLGSLQRMVQNIAIASGTAIGSTVMNILSNNITSSIRANWGIALALVLLILSLSIVFDRKFLQNNIN